MTMASTATLTMKETSQSAGNMENVAQHIQRLQLGPGSACHRRTRRLSQPVPAHAVHARGFAHQKTTMRHLMAQSFESSDQATYFLQNARGQSTPVFQVAYGNRASTSHLLAAVDEDGTVSVMDTNRAYEQGNNAGKPSQPSSSIYQHVDHRWRAHDNAIFDAVWSHDDAHIITAAGDLQVCSWDVETKQALYQLKGHQMSVKCVRQATERPWLLASGGRDGNVLLWDTRAPTAPVAKLADVHAAHPAPASSLSTRSPHSKSPSFVSPLGTRKRRKTGVVNNSPRSVTCVEFTGDDREIITAGAVDGLVKFWDIRRLTTDRGVIKRASVLLPPMPVRTLSCSSRTTRGITSLALDATRSWLLVNVLNDELRVFDVRGKGDSPLLRCDGHVANSFYVKSCFSPDGDFIMSGSGDGTVYMWDASTIGRQASSRKIHSPVFALKGHGSEVNGVSWHSRDFTRLASCSDDGTIRVWRADRSSNLSRMRQSDESSGHFQLKRKEQSWTNWADFERQDGGRAYRVDGDDVEVEMEEVTPVVKPIESSPQVIRRSSEMLVRSDRRTSTNVTPARTTPQKRSRPAPQAQTLLDFWQR